MNEAYFNVTEGPSSSAPLTPAITMIVGLDGVYALPVGLTYRYSDNSIFDLEYVALGGNFNFPIGYFRDRSQVAARMTLLVN